jgi:hypothetical protein
MNLGRAGSRIALATGVFALIGSGVARAEEPPELIGELIHSEVPLYTFDWDDLWPRGFSNGETFGCTSAVAFGDWQFVPVSEGAGQEYWQRFSNYGVFHCAAIIYGAEERAGLEDAQWRYGFFVRLGRARLGSAEWEIWALQSGMVPGSDYFLLARPAGQQGRIDSFTVLQQRCPSGTLRETEGLDVWNSRYCAINSRAELVALGRRMLRLPPRGTLTRFADSDERPRSSDEQLDVPVEPPSP